jgi:nicotinamidase-related amidase
MICNGGDAVERAYGLDIPQDLAEACSRRRTALLVYDMQVGIIRQMKNGAEIVAQVKRVLDAAREAGLRVFFMRHMSLPKEAAGIFQLRQAMAWQKVKTVAEVKPWFLRDSPAFQLVPELGPLPSEVIFDKITMSAFEGTPLDIVLRACGINSFIIAGVATEIGIEPTIRHGTDLGYIPIVVTDACGAGHADAGDRALASTAFLGDAILTDVRTIQNVLGGMTGD